MYDTHNIAFKKALQKEVKNECSVFVYPWKWNCWHGFWSNIHYFFRNFAYAWQRATKGYCYPDVVEADYSITNYLINLLTEFRNSTQTFPMDFSNYEDWIACIDDIINSLEFSRKDREELNGFAEQYKAITNQYENMTEEEKSILGKYWEEDTMIAKMQIEARQAAMERLAGIMPWLWM